MMERISPERRGKRKLRVWLFDDDASVCRLLDRALRGEDMQTRVFESRQSLLIALRRESPNVVIIDIRMSDGLDFLSEIRALLPALPVIALTAYSDIRSAVAVYRSGAFDYLTKPFDIDEVLDLVQRAAAPPAHRQPENKPVSHGRELLARSAAMQPVVRAIGRLARSNVNVLITGESGTGKELVARALHSNSPGAGNPFVALSAAAMRAEFSDMEYFNCAGDVDGRSQEDFVSRGGTLFLEEIADMPMPVQAKLLRYFNEGEFSRDAAAPRYTQVRIIATTQHNLRERVSQGLFHRDLFHRLDVVRIQIPPLRARAEDIPALLDCYLDSAARDLGISRKALTKDVQTRLTSYGWPGNVRELINLCMRVSLMAPGHQVRLEDLPAEFSAATVDPSSEDWASALASWAHRYAMSGKRCLLDEAQPEFERALITAALKSTRGRRREASELLGWGRNTLTYKMKCLGMSDTTDNDALDPPSSVPESA